MAKKRITIAKPDIINYLDNIEQTTFRQNELSKILTSKRKFWRLTQSQTLRDFIGFLEKEGKLKEHIFQFPNRKETLYSWGNVPLLEIIRYIKKKSYFTHYSAVYLHNLTEQLPKSIFLNFEQPLKPKSTSKLQQNRIDYAFKGKMRTTHNIAKSHDYKIFLLNGMFTNNLGVIDIVGPNDEKVNVTNIERTLIDITVRPEYSGGVYEVLKAYKNAKENVSINKLCAILKKVNYTYPYHQAIGFYLEKSGVYSEQQIDLLRNFNIEYNFYLTYNMKETDYSDAWKLFIPKGF